MTRLFSRFFFWLDQASGCAFLQDQSCLIALVALGPQFIFKEGPPTLDYLDLVHH